MEIDVKEVYKLISPSKNKSVALTKGDQMYYLPRIPFKKFLWILRKGKVQLTHGEHEGKFCVSDATLVSYDTGEIKGCATFICRDEVDTAVVFLPKSQPAISQNETLF